MAAVERVRATVREVSGGEVVLTTTNGPIRARAAQAALDAAGQLTGELIATIVTSASGTRLLALRTHAEQDARTRVPPVEDTLDRFDGVLRILAR